MIYIQNFDKMSLLFTVTNDMGEEKRVTANDIMRVLLDGKFKIYDTHLTENGFKYKYFGDSPNDVYINFVVNNLTPEQKHKAKTLFEREVEWVKRQQRESSTVQPNNSKPTARVKAKVKVSPQAGGNKITGNKNNQAIYYKSKVYISDNQLCKEYNRDLTQFRAMYSQGYSIDESLGLIPPRPLEEVIALRKKREKQSSKIEKSLLGETGQVKLQDLKLQAKKDETTGYDIDREDKNFTN